jgi:hypothetical protein
MDDDVSASAGRLLGVLKNLPLWMFAGIAGASLLVLLVPPLFGIKLDAFRDQYGPWLWVVFAFSGFLTLTRAVDLLVEHRIDAKKRLPFHVTPVDNHCRWGVSKQSDGTYVTNLDVHLMVKNKTDHTLSILTAKLLRPRMRGVVAQTPILILNPSTATYGSAHGSGNFIDAHDTAPGHFSALSRGVFGIRGKPLKIVLLVGDDEGNTQRVKLTVQPMPGGFAA